LVKHRMKCLEVEGFGAYLTADGFALYARGGREEIFEGNLVFRVWFLGCNGYVETDEGGHVEIHVGGKVRVCLKERELEAVVEPVKQG